jgi:GT2 family glycosyltransferase
MKYSILIPVKKINNFVKKNIKIINSINPKKTEIIIIVNKKDNYQIQSKINLKIIESGICSPGIKRDLGAKIATGSFLIFFDDDSFPQKNYFDNLSSLILTTKYEIFAGPGVTPKYQTNKQRISGAFFLSYLRAASISRYIPTFRQIVDDWPSVNLVIKKNIFNKIKGFNNNYWPGEDTFLCDKLKKINKKILYSPDLIVFHHRREGFFNHLKQISGYGFHRGYFARKYKKTSLKLIYFLPSIFILTFFLAIINLIFFNNLFYLLILLLFYSALLIFLIFKILKYEALYISIGTLPNIISSHIIYGISFLKGLLTFSNIEKDKKYLLKFK